MNSDRFSPEEIKKLSQYAQRSGLSDDEVREFIKNSYSIKQAVSKRFNNAVTTSAGSSPQQSFTMAEYKKRLEKSLKQDSVIVHKQQERSIKQSLATWMDLVGPRFANAQSDSSVVVDRVERLYRNSGQHKTSLVLYGGMGTGKTWHAYGFINALLQNGIVTAAGIMHDTETGSLGRISSSGFRRAELFDQLLNPKYRVYFIDDVGQGYFMNEQSRTEIWYELIDHVYTHNLTLILTTNKNPMARRGDFNGLEGWIGPRAFDRLTTLVGPDGFYEPSKINQREKVFEAQEEEYRSGESDKRK